MIPPPNDEVEVVEILNRLEAAIKQLLLDDIHLLRYDVNERTITHKLGEYLQPLFREWSVDCEYNRDGNKPKNVNLPEEDTPGAKQYHSVYPDIIVHKRGKNDHNPLIIEAKKSTDQRRQRGEERDINKLKAYADQLPYKYKVGVFIRFYTRANDARLCQYKYYHECKWSEFKDCSWVA